MAKSTVDEKCLHLVNGRLCSVRRVEKDSLLFKDLPPHIREDLLENDGYELCEPGCTECHPKYK